ncbi:MAG: hypothetical protein JNK15_09635 [Planctomycetes bacterium]|nr:hypothetical protein [Planctomycetota bacterium]
MTEASRLSVRDRRIVLALAGAAVVWRWLVVQRTPLPGVDACRSLWLADEFARGSFVGLASAPGEALWAALLAPWVACGVTSWTAAQIVACALGGLVVVVVAIAAERWRESAGVPAAVLAMVVAGPVVAAGAGSVACLQAALVAVALWGLAARRWWWCGLVGALAFVPGFDALQERDPASILRAVRLGGIYLVPVALLWVLPPRPVRSVWLLVAWSMACAVAVLGSSLPALLPAVSPCLAVLGGIGLARLPARGRELVVCAVVLGEMHGAWSEVEPPSARVERVVGRLLRQHLRGSESLVSDRARVLWSAGQWPAPVHTPDAVLAAAARPEVAFLVLDVRIAKDATVAASLAGTFARHEISADLTDLLAEHGLQMLVRRRRP